MSGGKGSMGGLMARLAVFVILATLMCLIVVYTLLDVYTSPTHTYKAVFTDATGLIAGNNVDVAGVQVGKVGSIALDTKHTPPGKTPPAIVTFTVNKSLQLKTSTVAQINFADLIGQRFLNLSAGKNDGKPLAPGATLPAHQTINGLDLSALENAFQPLFNLLTPSQINKLTGEIIATFQGEGGSVASLTNSVASLASNLAGKSDAINAVIDNFTPLVNTLAEHNPQINQLIQNFEHLVQGLAPEAPQIGQAIDSVSNLTQVLSNDLGQTQGNLPTDINNLSQVSQELVANNGAFSQTIQNLPGMLNVLDKAASTGSYLNVYLCNLGLYTNGPAHVSLVPGVNATLNLPNGQVGANTFGGPGPGENPSQQNGENVQHTQVCQ